MSERIVRGHIFAVIPQTEWHHCADCGGCGYLDQPNSFAEDCPKMKVSTLHLNSIFTRKLDYRRGKWVQLNVK